MQNLMTKCVSCLKSFFFFLLTFVCILYLQKWIQCHKPNTLKIIGKNIAGHNMVECVNDFLKL